MVDKVIVYVGYQNIENQSVIKLSRVFFGLGTMCGQSIYQFGVTATFTVP